MKYVKSCLIITMLLGIGYSQCDANGDGDLDVLDVIIEGECILTQCWEGNQVCEGVEDIDGNCYETIQIGDQLWLAENLKVTHYNDDSYISSDHTAEEWDELETGAYAVYDDDPSNADIYGYLYNWYALDDERGLCPEGFHVPSDEEFMELEMYLGMSYEEANLHGFRGTNEGSQLAGNYDLWTSQYSADSLVSDSEFGTSGFNALPSGLRYAYPDIDYGYINGYTTFWTTTIHNWGDNVYLFRAILYSDSKSYRSYSAREFGKPIRCLED